ncbi:restriction endonuclease subunit S [Pseudomonas syringae]|uniref:restriction endonuclease subunit S n=1 Tax=Pseudomonas syringae TaxID=317 RepID=UPI0003AB0388
MNWSISCLSDVSEFIRNGASIPQSKEAGGVPITRIESISERVFNPGKCGYAGLGEGEYLEYRLKLGDIMISHINSEKHLAKCAIFEDDGFDVIHGMNLLCLRPNQEKIFPKFLFHYLSSSKFIQLIPAITKKSVNQASFTVTAFKTLEVPLPPLPEQKRIAAILDKADAIRRKRQQAIQLADDFLRAVFLDMFGDPVTNPKGWNLRPVKEMAKVTTGNTPPRDKLEYYGDFIEWIKSDNINSPSDFLTVATEYLSEAGCMVGRRVPTGSTLLTCIAGSFDCIGNAAYADREVSFNQQINALTPRPGVDGIFLYALSKYCKKAIQAASTGGMKGMVSKGKLEEVRFICPPESMQQKFAEAFRRHQDLRKRMGNSQDGLSDEFSSISQKAFSGHL